MAHIHSSTSCPEDRMLEVSSMVAPNMNPTQNQNISQHSVDCKKIGMGTKDNMLRRTRPAIHYSDALVSSVRHLRLWFVVFTKVEINKNLYGNKAHFLRLGTSASMPTNMRTFQYTRYQWRKNYIENLP